MNCKKCGKEIKDGMGMISAKDSWDDLPQMTVNWTPDNIYCGDGVVISCALATLRETPEHKAKRQLLKEARKRAREEARLEREERVEMGE